MLAAVDMLQHEVLRNATKQAAPRLAHAERNVQAQRHGGHRPSGVNGGHACRLLAISRRFRPCTARGHHRICERQQWGARCGGPDVAVRRGTRPCAADLAVVEQRAFGGAGGAAEEKRRAAAERAVCGEDHPASAARGHANARVHAATAAKGAASSRRPLQLKVGAQRASQKERSQKDKNVHLWKQKLMLTRLAKSMWRENPNSH